MFCQQIKNLHIHNHKHDLHCRNVPLHHPLYQLIAISSGIIPAAQVARMSSKPALAGSLAIYSFRYPCLADPQHRQQKLMTYARIRVNGCRRVKNFNFRWANRLSAGLPFICIAAAAQPTQDLKGCVMNMCFAKPMFGSNLPRKAGATSRWTDCRKGLLRVVGQCICHQKLCSNL